MAEVASLNLAQANKIADLKAALEACQKKWHDEGFTNAEKSVEPVVHQAWLHGFEEGWLVALQVMGVAEDSPLKNPEQIPYPAPLPLAQSQADVADEENNPNMRVLVQAIDTHMDTIDLEVTNNLNVVEDTQAQQPPADPTEGAQGQQADDAAHLPPIDPPV